MLEQKASKYSNIIEWARILVEWPNSMHRKALTRYNSTVNRVELVEYYTLPKSVVKKFDSTAVATSINLPKDRIWIESRTSILLQSLLTSTNFLKTPRIHLVNYEQCEIVYEHVDAPTLLEYLIHNPPPKAQLYELFAFLKMLESIDHNIVGPIFAGVDFVAKNCGQIQTQYKFPNESLTERDRNQFCLGDVSLSNILFDGRNLWLIDFEFARMFFGSFDRSQLLAQLLVVHPRACKDRIDFGFQELCKEEWFTLFQQYYSRKYLHE